ncbi:MAG: site-specific integrase, partial [Desulfamplus sp.]|nr:site-specific integrase [Desulfamplus sp.]
MPEERTPRYVPPEDDFWKAYNLAEGQDQVMIFTSLHLATRRGELFRLKLSDIDFSNSTVTLWTRKRKGGNLEADVLPMTEELKKVLSSWCKKRFSYDTVDKEHVFVCLDEYQFCLDYYGKPFKTRQHFMEKLCKKAGVKKFGFHAIRHLTASILYRKGCSVSFIQKVLRHKNPTTTDRYLRTLGLEDVREGMNEALCKPSIIASH